MDILFCIMAAILLTASIYKKKENFSNIIFIGFVLRIALMIVDLYHIFPLLHSGNDSERFDTLARSNVNLSATQQYGSYSTFLTIVYRLFNSYHPRMVAQFINVLFGVGVLIVLRKCLNLTDIRYKTKRNAMLIVAFLPNMMILSSILLREAWVEYFTTLSLYFFLKWFYGKGWSGSIYLSIMSCLTACYMHAGVIGLLPVFFIVFLSYNPMTQKIRLSLQKILPTFIILFITASVFLNHTDIFGAKFAILLDPESDSGEIIQHSLSPQAEVGGSRYLQWLNVSSPIVGFLCLPLRMFYFLFSPLPSEWHGLNDIVAFALDGFVYLYVVWQIAKSFSMAAYKRLRKYLVLAVLLVTAIFSLGTYTAGTAMRHRAKILPVIAFIYAVSVPDKRNKKVSLPL